MNIIIMGPPASGKGTHSKFITEKYKNFKYISIGELLRKSNDNNIKDKIKKGILIDDDTTFNILNDYIVNNIKNKNNLILDGFPRTYNQAKILELNNINIYIIIQFILDKENIIKRISGRKIHINSGRIYHDLYNPPIIKDLDDLTGEKLVIRNDDNIEIINKRINDYNNNEKSIISFYRKKINNNIIKLIKINTNDTIENIKKMLLYKLSNVI
ncbi:adenylate kinase family protein [Candidatus Nardonella dryophthoridicola]|nr:nucleoside monophosphate kinase [Candidatus Nardonella dryophthoridicola]QTJ62803.1 nucleoside monophosphate kinase [Candidatus Nardonella dryophthoridicola]